MLLSVVGRCPFYGDVIFSYAVFGTGRFVHFSEVSVVLMCLLTEVPLYVIFFPLTSYCNSSLTDNIFKHKIKENFFQNIEKEEDDIYVFYSDSSSSLPSCFV